MADDPVKKAERAKPLAGKSVTFPLSPSADAWHTFTLETAGDATIAARTAH
jgi:hypothetical protein